MQPWDKMDQSQTPSLAVVGEYVSSPLFDSLCLYLESEYQCKPTLEYSKCAMQRGWNVKYKKVGRALCTLYPMPGFFIVLIVIGEREATEVELQLPSFTEYMQRLYHETKAGMGQKWLMIHVTDGAVLEDVKRCITIRNVRKK